MVLTSVKVPQGFAANQPKKYVLDDEEYDRISKLAQLQLDDARDEEPEELEEGEDSGEKTYFHCALRGINFQGREGR